MEWPYKLEQRYLWMVLRLKRGVRFLLIAVIVFVEHSIKIQKMVCHKIERGHIFVFVCFAVTIHFGEIRQYGKIPHRQTKSPQCIKINEENF